MHLQESMRMRGIDCCQWEGIICNTSTGAVTELKCNLGNGTLSPSVCKLVNLEEVHLQGSHSDVMQRYIPSCIWYMEHLQILDLSTSGLQFEDPRFSNNPKVPSPRLTDLDLSDSNLTGVLPAWVGNLPSLQWPRLVSNSITGLPESIGNLSGLTRFTLNNNLISSFPVSIGRLASLVILEATNNLITEAPVIGNLSNLFTLDLSGNSITRLSPSITSLATFSTLSLDHNLLSEIHPSFGNMSGLWEISLTFNQLTNVELPTASGIFPLLQRINMEHNNMTSVPKFLGSCPVLYFLHLSDNLIESFEGFPNASRLMNLYLSNNRLVRFDLSAPSVSFSFPNISSIDLYGNNLRPVSLGNISSLYTLYLDDNLLQTIPLESILKQRNLHQLTIASNQLEGSIPESFFQLLEINSLDLSDNTLSGGIPSFALLKFISYCNLSYNRLSGPIPGGQMSTLDISNYIENPGLCDLPLPACSASTSPGIEPLISQGSSRSALDEWVSIPAVGIGFFVGFIAMTFSYLEMRRLEIASIFLVFNRHSEEDRLFAANQPYGAYVPPI
ncbi:hypothetical protein Mapa_001336 [Marchantia paleacea]|nr:hypothetical protein Mapa_001336 [Marchantia paleacea]